MEATDPGLFTICLHSEEIKTLRDISESDTMKQTLVVVVEDNGKPVLSATCTMYLLISDKLKDMSFDESRECYSMAPLPFLAHIFLQIAQTSRAQGLYTVPIIMIDI